MKKEKRDCYRKVKTQIEEEWKETDILRCFGNRQSLKSHQKDRLAQAFEPRLSPEHSQYEKLTLNDDGMIVQSEFVVEGQKQPLTVIRENFLKSHANYMRTVTDEELYMMSKEQVKERLVQVNAVFSDLDDVDALKAKLKDISHTCHLKIYDPALFYTNKEFEMKTKRKVDIQTIVESP
ncbi:Hypothetical predicted protein [Paramuricea clavata]|uniref:Uncharacterized protein n=1 Tax=Paramuricea clavata TaxID=317549 RepID=A0A6S7K036_PARCT|nr:Hypothetical predicted protein [Paramuricea clavata]